MAELLLRMTAGHFYVINPAAGAVVHSRRRCMFVAVKNVMPCFGIYLSVKCYLVFILSLIYAVCIRGYVHKIPDWLPGARTANGTALYY
jgi:hypothetical protein